MIKFLFCVLWVLKGPDFLNQERGFNREALAPHPLYLLPLPVKSVSMNNILCYAPYHIFLGNL